MPDRYDKILEDLKSGAYLCSEHTRAQLIKEYEEHKLFAESMEKTEEEKE